MHMLQLAFTDSGPNENMTISGLCDQVLYLHTRTLRYKFI